jgi:outer membrane protein assembly factor BamD (BamD/ComL family)
MMQRLVMVCLVSLLVAAGCSGDGGQRLYETAQFEEKQHNVDHAVKLYEEIVSKHPGTPFAVKANERLMELRRR